MKDKKFYQNYTLQREEEVLALMVLLYKDKVGTYMDELSSNFATEKTADGDLCDFSCSYMVTEELEQLVSEWVDIYKDVKDLFKAKGVNFEFVNKELKNLYKKMVGTADFEELLLQDRRVFGSDVDFYGNDSLVNMFKSYSR